uniref:Uncharacterized protein n=1 Tax=Arundo donax TaxID=35708 RepID=A0A0A8Z2Z8_ARUDO
MTATIALCGDFQRPWI